LEPGADRDGGDRRVDDLEALIGRLKWATSWAIVSFWSASTILRKLLGGLELPE
jgi:hypothetical protein